MGDALPRAAMRRLKRLVAANEPTIAADAKFFDRHPNRSFRFRQASQSEVQQLVEFGEGSPALPGRAWYATIRQIKPGVRARLFVNRPAGLDCDLSDSEAGDVFLNSAKGEAHCQRIFEQLHGLPTGRRG